MKKSKFAEEQIAFALRQAETGARVAEVCRKMGISEMTFYRFCFHARAGASIISGPTGSTARKDSTYAGSGLAVM